jgi:putative DNA-invertase from lambdoid prophage Rac
MNTKVALYVRVSTTDQTIDPQLLELREYAARNGFTIYAEYSDVISGAKAQRPGLDALLEKAGTEFSTVLAVKLDRLGRSVLNVVTLVQQLKKQNCSVICTSQGIDNRDENPCGKMIMGIMASMAEFERDLIRERTKAGLRATKAKGTILGRPSTVLKPNHAEIIAAWKSEPIETRPGYRVLAERLGGVSPMTARKLAMGQVPT